MGHEYKYCKSRPIEGTIKTLTVKRNALGEFYLIIVTKQECNDIYPRAGKAVGMDFGLTYGLEITAEDELTAEEVNKWLLLNTDN